MYPLIYLVIKNNFTLKRLKAYNTTQYKIYYKYFITKKSSKMVEK
jgi:hypothetical protein